MKIRRSLIIIAVLVVMVIFVSVYAFFDPSDSSASAFFPKCPFFSLTGYKCPGCGIQRALHALFNGNFIEAWHFNAFALVMLPVLFVFGTAELFRTRYPKYYTKINSPAISMAIFVAVVAWWILRNVFNW